MKQDPWYKAAYRLKHQSTELTLEVPHDVFSTLRIDEGTVLLLDHLSESVPERVLDLGCGYGALGLPIAAQFLNAQVDLVDRDLLAVKWALQNAQKNGLKNVHAFGSLGFRNLPDGATYDWILCNVPARIGKPFIQNILTAGQARLNPGGEVRVVVIRDLIPTLNEIARETGLQIQEVVLGPRHGVFRLSYSATAIQTPGSGDLYLSDPVDLYLRDQVKVGSRSFDRPFDLGGDDPKRLSASLPLLMDTLPRQEIPKKILCVRSGYGVLPLLCADRWPESEVFAFERDLLGVDYTRRNQSQSTLVQIIEGPSIMDVLSGSPHFDLITLELSPSAGFEVSKEEIKTIFEHLMPTGRALLVCLDKLAKEWVQPISKSLSIPLSAIASRQGFSVFEIQK